LQEAAKNAAMVLVATHAKPSMPKQNDQHSFKKKN
jgi:hypothetical protein